MAGPFQIAIMNLQQNRKEKLELNRSTALIKGRTMKKYLLYFSFICLFFFAPLIQAKNGKTNKCRQSLTDSKTSIREKKVTLLNPIVSSNMSIESNKVYTVRPTGGDHEFYVVFSTKVTKMINQNRGETRIVKSLKALLKGPVKDNWKSSGIKKIAGQKNLFEIKIMGRKSVGNFRIGVFLHEGIYYLTDWTYQHIERNSSFLESLQRAFSRAIDSKEPLYAL